METLVSAGAAVSRNGTLDWKMKIPPKMRGKQLNVGALAMFSFFSSINPFSLLISSSIKL